MKCCSSAHGTIFELAAFLAATTETAVRGFSLGFGYVLVKATLRAADSEEGPQSGHDFGPAYRFARMAGLGVACSFVGLSMFVPVGLRLGHRLAGVPSFVFLPFLTLKFVEFSHGDALASGALGLLGGLRRGRGGRGPLGLLGGLLARAALLLLADAAVPPRFASWRGAAPRRRRRPGEGAACAAAAATRAGSPRAPRRRGRRRRFPGQVEALARNPDTARSLSARRARIARPRAGARRRAPPPVWTMDGVGRLQFDFQIYLRGGALRRPRRHARRTFARP